MAISDQSMPGAILDWRVDWAVRRTWIRLSFATMALSFGVASALLASNHVDAIVIDLVARTGMFGWDDDWLVVDIARMIVICATISSILAALVQAISRLLSHSPKFEPTVGAVEALEEETVRKVWNSAFIVFVVWSFSFVIIIENLSSLESIFNEGYNSMFFFTLIHFVLDNSY